MKITVDICLNCSSFKDYDSCYTCPYFKDHMREIEVEENEIVRPTEED